MPSSRCALASSLVILAVQGALAANTTPTPKQVVANYTRPLSFEPNRGQTDKQVDFLAHGTGYGLFLSHADALMVFQRGGTSVRMKPVGANSSASAEPLDQQPSKSNYFIGNVPARWHTNLPNYAKVRYRGVYPGIDVIYYGNQQQLEYDFIVSPGADPNKILLDFQGATTPTLDRSGDLVMHTDAGDPRWRRPIAYQDINGDRKPIACSYLRKGSNRLAFQLAAYDRTSPLVIDPVLVYSTYLGGSGDQYGDGDQGNAIAVGREGDTYITGSTYSTDFPIKNAFQNSYKGDFIGTSNAFITKLDAAGRLVYSTYLGGSGNEQRFGSTQYPPEGDVGNGIAVDSYGNAYVAGTTGSFDFPLKNPFQTARFFLSGGFLTKLNSAGDVLVYSTYLSGDYQDSAAGVAVDSHGDAYVTGTAGSSDFPTKNAFQNTPKANPNAFVTKFDQDGDSLVYSTYLGGSGGDSANAIAIDAYGNAYVTGQTTSSDFPIKNAFQSENKARCLGCLNAFLTKFDAAGNALVYSTYLGGSGSDVGKGLVIDSGRHVFVTGATTSPDFPTQNAFQHKLKGSENAFITKFHYAGNSLLYSTYLGGSGSDSGNGIGVDAYDDAYVSGSTSSTDFPFKNAFQRLYSGGFADAFVTKLDAAGTALVYSSYLGGTGIDFANGIAVDTRGNAYVTGRTSSIDFPTKDAFQNTLESPGGDAFVTKISAH